MNTLQTDTRTPLVCLNQGSTAHEPAFSREAREAYSKQAQTLSERGKISGQQYCDERAEPSTLAVHLAQQLHIARAAIKCERRRGDDWRFNCLLALGILAFVFGMIVWANI